MSNSKECKLNVGCGHDYHEGFINVDGSADLPKVDIVMDIGPGTLLERFSEDSCDYILALDILEHFFHWEACLLLADFYKLLTSGGQLRLRLPNAESIINNSVSVAEKLTWLFGGQDIQPSEELDICRQQNPQYYCHKFGWTMTSLKTQLVKAGFVDIKFTGGNWNMGVTCKKG